MQRDHRIQIWQGCAPTVASAVESFCERWKPYSRKSRTHSIFRLFEEEIEPAWNTYIDSLPLDHAGHKLCRDLKLGRLARTVGFSTLEAILKAAIRGYCKHEENFYQQLTPSQRARFATPHPDFSADLEFESTLETLLIVTRECHNKLPKKKNLAEGGSYRLYHEYCEHCGEFTELSARENGQSRTGYGPDGAARLSTKYCWSHRPKFLDGTRNSEYLWAVRTKAEFDKELRRLQLQSRSTTKPVANTGDPYLDLFYMNLLGPRAIYPDELATLRNEARQLVDTRMDDRKKRIVIMRASGFSLAAIADEVGANSRQAVSKALATVSAAYRFDLEKIASTSDSDVSEGGFSGAISVAIDHAMRDPDVIEVMLNPDGSLWVDARTFGRKNIGRVISAEAEQIIRFVAEKSGISLTEHSPSIEVDFKSPRARFTGILPPIADNPTFSIRKMS